MFDKGSRVKVKDSGKVGTVAYKRMGPPDFSKPVAVSVVLDDRRNDLNYSGSIFSVEKLEEIKK